MSEKKTRTLNQLSRIGRRLWFLQVTNRFNRYLVYFSMAYLFLVATIYLCGLASESWPWFYALLPLPLAAGLASLISKSTPVSQAASKADEYCNSKDLFMTYSHLEESSGQYQQLVTEEVAQFSQRLHPKRVVPFDFQETFFRVSIVTALLLLITMFLPQADPFGVTESREAYRKNKRKLIEQIKQAAEKKEKIEKDIQASKKDESVKKSLEELANKLKRMDPQKTEQNKQALKKAQEQLSQLWKKAKEKPGQQSKNMNNTLSQPSQKQRSWQKQLNQGELSGLKNELNKAMRKTQELSNLLNKKKPNDQEKKQAQDLKRELSQSLRELSEFTRNNLDHPNLQEAIQQATEQLSKSNQTQLSKEALDAMKSSLNQAKSSANQTQQTLDEIKKLEEGLEAIQKAQEANQSQALDGSQLNQQSMKDMLDQLNQICKSCRSGQSGQQGQSGQKGQQGQQSQEGTQGQNAQSGQGSKGNQPGQSNQPGQGNQPGSQGQAIMNGQQIAQGQTQGQGNTMGFGGTGGAGQGNGGQPPEAKGLRAGFKPEKAPTVVGAGRKLLRWKTNELPPDGEARKNYTESVRILREAASDAIQGDDLPPGYHEHVKRYFEDDYFDKPAKDKE